MANMSYCRFENTLSDLKDCYNALEDARDYPEENHKLSKDEQRAKDSLIELCRKLVDQFGNDTDDN